MNKYTRAYIFILFYVLKHTRNYAIYFSRNFVKSIVHRLFQGPLLSYLELSQQIGGDVATQAKLVNAAFQ